MLTSLDPRVKRLPQVEGGGIQNKAPLDQFDTYEIFVQPKDGKPFQHEGAVHAPNLEMAYILAKETFTRRFTCSSLYVTSTRNVSVSPVTEGDRNVFELISSVTEQSGGNKSEYEMYYLLKRGKQHVHAGNVFAIDAQHAMAVAKDELKSDKTVYNVWAIPRNTIRFTSQEEKDLWTTLPEKKFRDAGDYKGGDKLKMFLEKVKN